MKVVKWIGISMAAAVALGGAMLVRAETTDTNQVSTTETSRPGNRGLGRLRGQLGLSREQAETIRTDIAAEKDTLKQLMTSLHEARINLRETIRKPGATENEIRGASARVASVEADFAVERAKLYGKISAVLTPDQLAKLDELQQRADDSVDGAIVGFGRRLAQAQ